MALLLTAYMIMGVSCLDVLWLIGSPDIPRCYAQSHAGIAVYVENGLLASRVP